MTFTNQKAKASYHTLGCKLNFAETASIQRELEELGVTGISGDETPDICLVNTCSVTAMADKKARTLIRGLARRYPEAAIIVTGCYAQLRPEEAAALPGVEMVVGSEHKGNIAQLVDRWLSFRDKTMQVTSLKEIRNFHGSCERGDRTRFFLKVQDGCNYYCSYCTIPFARGMSRSGKIADIAAMAKEAASRGGKEIVITGVNVGEFGKDHGEKFLDLLKTLDETEGIERFRISSIEPNLLTEEILEWIAGSSRRFMPHFHIPLQSGSDKVLQMMRRKYDTSLFSSRIEMIRQLMPDAFIGVDIIAGAHGETEEEWEKSLEFATGLDISRFHVFPYSEREGTRALGLGDRVQSEVRHKRAAILTRLSDEKLSQFFKRNLQSVRPVLWETITAKGKMQGLTDNYLRVEAQGDATFLNTVSNARLTSMNEKRNDMANAIPE